MKNEILLFLFLTLLSSQIIHTYTIEASQKNNTSIKINVATKNIPVEDHNWYNVTISFIISVLLIAVVIYIVKYILTWHISSKNYKDLSFHASKYCRILSLSLFQFIVWHVILLFSFIWLMLIRFFAGFSLPHVPITIFILSGISLAATCIVRCIKVLPNNSLSRHDIQRVLSFSIFVQENRLKTITRIQMLLWTCTGSIIYFAYVLLNISQTTNIKDISLPDASIFILGATFLSLAIYIGYKIVHAKPVFLLTLMRFRTRVSSILSYLVNQGPMPIPKPSQSDEIPPPKVKILNDGIEKS